VVKTSFGVAAALWLCACPSHARTEPQAAPPPLTYRAALDLAVSRNLGLAAARRQRAIRAAQVKVARQWANPDVSVEVTKDTPHQTFTLGIPIEIGGQRGRRIALATEELTLADLDERAEMRILRRNLRQAFSALVASDERVRLATEVVALAERAQQVAQTRFDRPTSGWPARRRTPIWRGPRAPPRWPT
jgi:cobalt-zinc-cadmium efflux system outer membrane protein